MLKLHFMQIKSEGYIFSTFMQMKAQGRNQNFHTEGGAKGALGGQCKHGTDVWPGQRERG